MKRGGGEGGRYIGRSVARTVESNIWVMAFGIPRCQEHGPVFLDELESRVGPLIFLKY